MKQSDAFMISGVIVAAPHLPAAMALTICAGWMVLSVILGFFETPK